MTCFGGTLQTWERIILYIRRHAPRQGGRTRRNETPPSLARHNRVVGKKAAFLRRHAHETLPTKFCASGTHLDRFTTEKNITLPKLVAFIVVAAVHSKQAGSAALSTYRRGNGAGGLDGASPSPEPYLRRAERIFRWSGLTDL